MGLRGTKYIIQRSNKFSVNRRQKGGKPVEKYMNAEERTICKNWIRKNIDRHTRKQSNSYVLKHIFQRFSNIYSSDSEFQELMQECGFLSDEKYHSIFYAKVNPEVAHAYYSRHKLKTIKEK